MKADKITIRISEYEKEQLKSIAANKDVPMSQLIREMIKNYINQEVK